MNAASLSDIFDGPSPQHTGADYYAIIGCDETANEEQIQTEYKRRALELHPDKQEKDSTSQDATLDAFQRLQEAREVLLDPEMRAKYDRWRRSGLAIPFKQYANIKSTSLHWVTKGAKELAVTDGSVSSLSKKDDMDYATAAAAAAAAKAGRRRQTLTGGETSLKSWHAKAGGPTSPAADGSSSSTSSSTTATTEELLRKFRNYEI